MLNHSAKNIILLFNREVICFESFLNHFVVAGEGCYCYGRCMIQDFHSINSKNRRSIKNELGN